jgi:pimeloyl-ACP methyl ester carboxylesterase
LSADHTFIRYDERGCGLSAWEVGEFSFEDWVDDLESVVDAIGLQSFPLLVVSQGGAVAIEYAARHPEKVSHLVLCSPYARGRGVRALSPEEQRAAELDLDLARVGWGRDDPGVPPGLRAPNSCPTLIMHSRDDHRVRQRRLSRLLQPAPPLEFGTRRSTVNGVPVTAILVNGDTRLG